MSEHLPRLEPSRLVPLFVPPIIGPLTFVAQSPGTNEVQQGAPLVGASGKLLQECAERAGIDWPTCPRTNLIPYQPPGNDFGFFCAKKAEVGGKDYAYPQIASGQYLRPEWLPELERLRDELVDLKPNLVVSCGNEALWALCGVIGITKYRGSIVESTLVPGLKVLPVMHPAAVLRDYSMRATLIQDLIKARTEQGSPAHIRIPRRIWLYPDIDDLYAFENEQAPLGEIVDGRPLVSVDIENPGGPLSCIGFAWTAFDAMCVPFISELRPGRSYWRTAEEEQVALAWVQGVFTHNSIIGQNFYAYDAWVLMRDLGIRSCHIRRDTMLQHAAYQPELLKGLGFLTSAYANETAYKTLRPRGQKSDKRDE